MYQTLYVGLQKRRLRAPRDPQQQGIAALPEARRFRGANFRARPEDYKMSHDVIRLCRL